jgi:ATP-binding cassette subfamily B multidrug efflux pump
MVKKLLWDILSTRPTWRLLIVFTSLLATTLGLLGPFYQKAFIDSFSTSDPSMKALVISFVCLALAMVFNMLANYWGVQESLEMQKIFADRIYKKTLSLRSDSLSGKTTGEIVSIYATDIPGSTAFLDLSLPQGAGILFPMILTPWVLIQFLAVPATPLLLTLFFIVLVSFGMAYRQSLFFYQFKKLAADRIGIVNEWIQNIRTLRILGWIASFERKIFQVREVETINRIRMVTNGQAMNAVSSSISFLLNIVVISSVVFWSSQSITAGQLLTILWIVAVFLTRSFRQLPWFFTFVFDSWTSLKRLATILELENKNSTERMTTYQKIQTLSDHQTAISVKNLDLKIGNHHLLKNISFDVAAGEFVAIVGQVGSGKSLLLLSLLGETSASFSSYRLFGNDGDRLPIEQLRQFYSFVPQEGFIMSASLRENVAFEYDIDSSRDTKIFEALQKAQFDLTKERVQQGLDTEIGERGVNLSGGQKQRVSLARVDFYQSPIILLDDCLSAVDVETEKNLVNEILTQQWKDRTRLLITHRLSVLEKVDRVLFLDHGELVTQGRYKDLLATHSGFRQFVASVAQDESRSEMINKGSFDQEPHSMEATQRENVEPDS